MRDADLRLYDAACDVLEAARALHVHAGVEPGATAIAPTLGCLQASLEELEGAVAALHDQLRDTPSRRAVHHLVAALRVADRAADAARAAAAAGANSGLPAHERHAAPFERNR